MPRLLLAFLLLSWANLWAQSLIIDGGFDELNDRPCIHPGLALDSTRYWYYAWGTPDFMVRNCPHIRGGGLEPFWSTYPSESFVAFGGVAGFDNFFRTEAVGTKLREPMEPGRMYYLSMELENKGLWNDVPRFPVQDCPMTPRKRIGIHFDVDSILEREQLLEPEIILDHPDLVGSEHKAFNTYTACLIASEPAEHLAIGWAMDSFTIAPPCKPVGPFGFGSYYLTFAYVDRVQLHPIPDEFQETLTLCKGQPFTTIDLIEWVRTYPLLSISFDWKDGYEGAYRVFDQPGIYEVEVIFPCGRIPGEVEVLTQDCRPYFYVPSAFSPNGDDVNDTFQAILQSPIEVLDFQFRVYDRWGRKMAEWTDPNFKWDGSNLSGNVRPGVYMWEVAMTFSRNGEVLGHRDKGALTILK